MRASDVLYCAGEFCVGDPVYIAFRTSDGSQFVVATGIAACDDAALRQAADPAHRPPVVRDGRDGADVVVQEQDVQLLWPATA